MERCSSRLSLPLASPALQGRLHLGDASNPDAEDLRTNLSGQPGRDGWLWLAATMLLSPPGHSPAAQG
jgi:hypothetical protein